VCLYVCLSLSLWLLLVESRHFRVKRPLAAVPLVEWPSGRGLVGLFEGFEERGVLGNDMILERGRQQQHQQKQLNKTTTTTTSWVLGGWSVQQDRECGGAVYRSIEVEDLERAVTERT